MDFYMDYRGKKAAFFTLGCKLNFSETSTIAGMLETLGFEKVDFEEKADLYVINTCTVTNAGERSSRNAIRRAIRKNPDAMVVVTGCYAQLGPDEIAAIEGVDLVLGSHEKFNIPAWLGDLSKKEKPVVAVSRLAAIRQFHPSLSQGDRTRSFLKIQDGCSYFCTYCAVPYARGKSRSGNISGAIALAQKSIENGFKEIVLTGVNIGDFGRQNDETFLQLLQAFEKIDATFRLRIGSVEPNLLTDEIIAFIAQSQKIMPHFHIPLQAGTDEILTLMKRKYSTGFFRKKIETIRKLIPDAFVGVDVIAGMNGETGELFRQSYDFVNSLDISQLHAFPYSERKNTQALTIPHKVAMSERKIRTQKYINLSEKKLRAFYEKNIGKIKTVLFEEKTGENSMEGFSENYIRVVAPYNKALINNLVPVKLENIRPDGKMSGIVESLNY